MAITIEGVPARIRASDVRAVVEEAFEVLNKHIAEKNAEHREQCAKDYPDVPEEDIADEDLWEYESISRLTIGPERATAHEAGSRSVHPNGFWGAHWGTAGHSRDFPVSVEQNVRWSDRLGIDAKNSTLIDVRSNYVQATVFYQEDGSRKLRQDVIGYMKHTIDIPIVEE